MGARGWAVRMWLRGWTGSQVPGARKGCSGLRKKSYTSPCLRF